MPVFYLEKKEREDKGGCKKELPVCTKIYPMSRATQSRQHFVPLNLSAGAALGGVTFLARIPWIYCCFCTYPGSGNTRSPAHLGPGVSSLGFWAREVVVRDGGASAWPAVPYMAVSDLAFSLDKLPQILASLGNLFGHGQLLLGLDPLWQCAVCLGETW